MSAASSARKPLVAGNWKMHNNHLEALALTQQLAFRLNDKDFAAADIVVLPPFTALRSVQTLVQGDKLKLQYGAQDVSPHQPTGPTPATSAAGCSPSLAAGMCWPATPSGGSITTKVTNWSTPRCGPSSLTR